MKLLVLETERAWQALGQISYGRSDKESQSLKFRRSLYISQDLGVGDTLNADNLKVIRPGYGLAPKYLDRFIGKKLAKAAKAGTPLSWDMV
jgi:N-acetylneuraminate synthase